MPSLDQHRYWRSLDELADSPEFRSFIEAEFPSVQPETITSASRRSFLKLMGASFALAGLVGCRWPKEKIVPFAHRPEGRVPGEADQYATALELGGAASGLLVTSVDGRPIKIEGNPNHPESLGATSAIAQAAILELYDPDRSSGVVQKGGNDEYERSWQEFVTAAGPQFSRLRAQGGQGLHVLSCSSSSPSLAALRARFAEVAPRATWHEYEPLSRDNERAGTELAFGAPLRPVYRLAGADVILSLDDDFLLDHPSALRLAREFGERRRGEKMNRLWVVESALTMTGAAADERHPVAAQLVPVIAMRIAAGVLGAGGALGGALGKAAQHPFKSGFVDALVNDLASHRGRAVVTAGPRQPAEVHALAALMNVALGAEGRTVTYVAAEGARASHADALRELAVALKSGAVDTLVVLGANPVYDAPAELAFADALARARNTIHVGVYRDETGRACAWHVPGAHALESWSDARAWDGTVTVVQPLIEPLFGGRTAAEIVALMIGDGPQTAYDIVNATFAKSGGNAGAWRHALNAGVVEGTAFPAATAAPRPDALAPRIAAFDIARAGDGAAELVFLADAKVWDGRFANNAWLQELPDPITRVVWDNPLLVSPAFAAKLGLVDGDLVKITAGGRSLEAAAMLLPGMAENTVAIALGYGRRSAGGVGNGVGFNAYTLRSGGERVIPGVTVEKTGRRYQLVTTQHHWAIDTVGKNETERRAKELIREGDLAEYEKNPEFAKEGQQQLFSLWKEFTYEGHAWAMAIDLSSCTGCGACAVACQAENNIPVVGKDQVARGRHMNWLRIDRYFKGDPKNPSVAFQPMACVHCENAPCEQVCPVGATTHSHEGLNQMVYNRCIGTRYCSNNCPYKVRRFNFYNFNADLSQLQMMQKNPEVTVRGRGVMEKCTYCTQRIEAVRIKARNDRREIRDGEIVTACAQACPTRAIAFGDLNDKDSAVRRLHEHQRSYAVLADLNTKPRTHYLARLKNPATGERA